MLGRKGTLTAVLMALAIAAPGASAKGGVVGTTVGDPDDVMLIGTIDSEQLAVFPQTVTLSGTSYYLVNNGVVTTEPTQITGLTCKISSFVAGLTWLPGMKVDARCKKDRKERILFFLRAVA